MADLAKCEHCLTGHIHKGQAQHGVRTVGGVPAYVAPGASEDKAIVVCTDIFGYELPNVRLLADKMAAISGFSVYVPDVLHGEAINPGAFDRATFGAWRERHGDEQTMPVVKAVMEDLRATYGVKKLATIGYCFGGRFSALACAAGLADVYAVAHPSFITAETFTTLKNPGMFLCAETDQQFAGPLADEVEASLKAQGIPVEFRRYPGTTHGFAVRSNEDDAKVMAARDDALQGACEFFMKHLA